MLGVGKEAAWQGARITKLLTLEVTDLGGGNTGFKAGYTPVPQQMRHLREQKRL